MNDRENDTGSVVQPSRGVAQSALLVGLGVLIGAAAVWLATRPGPRVSDRYYSVYASIIRAEKLANILHLKSPDRRHPLQLSDIHGWSESDFKDAWGKPFRYAAVSDVAGNDPDIFVWTEWTQDDGRIALIGAKVSAEGKATRFGLPPQD
jgi:hypothetical protein